MPKEVKDNSSQHIINGSLSISITGNNEGQRVHNVSVNFLRRFSNRTDVFIDNEFPTVDVEVAIIEP